MKRKVRSTGRAIRSLTPSIICISSYYCDRRKDHGLTSVDWLPVPVPFLWVIPLPANFRIASPNVACNIVMKINEGGRRWRKWKVRVWTFWGWEVFHYHVKKVGKQEVQIEIKKRKQEMLERNRDEENKIFLKFKKKEKQKEMREKEEKERERSKDTIIHGNLYSKN